MLKLFFVSILTTVTLSAGWMFVNDDGSLSPYSDGGDFVIPAEEVIMTEPIKPVEVVKPKIVKKVVKEAIPKVERLDDEEKIMYLTFDDGPLAGSANIVSVLSQEAIPATMFMVGKHIKRNAYRKKIYQDALDEPQILVANHTYTHANGRYKYFYSSANRVLNDVSKMDAMLAEDDIHYGKRYCRLAGRNVFRLPEICEDDPVIKKRYDEKGKYDVLYDAGYQIYGWDYQWSYNPKNGKPHKSPEALVKSIEKIYKRGRTKKPNKFILLMHDFSFQDRFKGKQALQRLISALEKKGWSFATLESY